MFYIQNTVGEDEQVIVKSNMDGSEESILLDMNFHHSKYLTIDEWTKTLYWFEMKKGKLHSASFDGINKKVKQQIFVKQFIRNNEHDSNMLWNFVIFQEYSVSGWDFSTHFSILVQDLFFTREQDNVIYTAENMTLDKLKQHTDVTTNNIRQLFTYNPLLQPTHEVCILYTFCIHFDSFLITS